MTKLFAARTGGTTFLRHDWPGLRRAARFLALAWLALPAIASACSDGQPMRFILTTSAGGAADIVARAVSQELAKLLSRPIVIDYKPGGGALIGTSALASAPADGCAIGLMTNQYVMLPLLKPELPFDPVKSLAPVAFLGAVSYVWLVRPDAPYRTLQQLLAAARERPGRISFASGGTGSVSHLLPLAFGKQGAGFYGVPYGGQAQALNAFLGRQVDMVVEPIGTAIAHVASGKARALVTTGNVRSSALPDVPTITEAGVPFRAVSVFAVMAPSATRPEVISSLNAAINASMGEATVRSALQGLEFSIETGTPAYALSILAQERQSWGQVVRDNKVRSD